LHCNERRLPRRSATRGGGPSPHRATARQAIFNCGENEIRASLINSASAGATPAPATSLLPTGPRLGRPIWEVIRLLDCKSSVKKHVSEATNWSVTSTSHQPSLVGLRRAKAAAPKRNARRRAIAPPSYGSAGQPSPAACGSAGCLLS
jgi:hypothetical protein